MKFLTVSNTNCTIWTVPSVRPPFVSSNPSEFLFYSFNPWPQHSHWVASPCSLNRQPVLTCLSICPPLYLWMLSNQYYSYFSVAVSYVSRLLYCICQDSNWVPVNVKWFLLEPRKIKSAGIALQKVHFQKQGPVQSSPGLRTRSLGAAVPTF